jgi:hypothetical protein
MRSVDAQRMLASHRLDSARGHRVARGGDRSPDRAPTAPGQMALAEVADESGEQWRMCLWQPRDRELDREFRSVAVEPRKLHAAVEDR